jgi:hypothetical protein
VGKAALGRTGFSRKLMKRQLDEKVIVLRRTPTVEDGQAIEQDYSTFAILDCHREEAYDFGRSQVREGEQTSSVKYPPVLFEHTADLKESDRLVFDAVITDDNPITYAGGETVDIIGIEDFTTDRTYVAVSVVRKHG